jgi:Xaa-Pro aminopeptidase
MPSERPVEEGEPVVIDIGARVEGYCSDITRTICLGEKSGTFRKIYESVLDAQRAAMAIIRENIGGDEADSSARRVIDRAGYKEAFGHSLGHGIGLAPHESPRLGPKSKDVLATGMVFSIEPGIYLPGWGGVRIEDLVALNEDCIRPISNARKGLT